MVVCLSAPLTQGVFVPACPVTSKSTPVSVIKARLSECQTELCVVFASSDCGGCFTGLTLSQDSSVLDPSGLGSSVLSVLSQQKECF